LAQVAQEPAIVQWLLHNSQDKIPDTEIEGSHGGVHP